VTTSTPPATTSSAPVTHPKKKHVAPRHRRTHTPAAKLKQETAVLAAGSDLNAGQTSAPRTASTSSSSASVPPIAIFASVAAASLVLLAAIALGVSILVSRNRPDRKVGGGNILIR
jgi:hypothetical protein